MSKTPFEIRLELIKIAQSAIWDNFNNKSYRYESQFSDSNNPAKRLGPKDADGNPTFLEPPAYPTTEDILAEAEKLNLFVSERKTFHIDANDLSPEDAKAHVDREMRRHRRHRPSE